MKWTTPRFALFLALALAIWLGPSIFGGRVLMPLDIVAHNPPHQPAASGPVHNPLIGDMVNENLAWKEFQRRSLAAGELPLWNPASFCGHPIYTTGQASTFYPLNAIFWAVSWFAPLLYAYALFTWLHLLLGGVFTYLLFRRFGAGEFGAAVGGVTFAMGGFLTVRVLWPMLLGSIIWLPLMLLWIDVMAEPKPAASRLRGLFLGSLLFALPILSGFFEIAFYSFAACALFTAVAGVRLATRHRSASRCGIFLGKVAAVAFMATVISAPQILPFLEVMKRNVRAGQGSWETARASALWPRELLTLIVPDAFGNPARHESLDLRNHAWHPIRSAAGDDFHYFGPKNYVESGWYFGVIPFAFALLGLWVPARERLFFCLLIALALAFALVTPAYRAFFHLVPGSDQVRTPYRWLLLAVFAGTYLAATGAQYWYDRLVAATGKPRRGVATLLGVFGVAVFAGTSALFFLPEPMESLASALLTADTRARGVFKNPADLAGLLWLNGWRLGTLMLIATTMLAMAWWQSRRPRPAAAVSLAALSLVALDLGQASFSFNTHADPAVLGRFPASIQHMQEDKGLFRIGRYGPEKVFYANQPGLYGLQDYGGYDSIILTDFADFMNAIEPQNLLMYNIIMTIERKKALDSPLLPLLGIRYLMSAKPFEHPDWQEVPLPGNVKLYRVRPEKELPRAFLVDRVEAVNSLGEALARLKSGQLDLARTAVVEAPADRAKALAEPGEARSTTVTIEHYGFSSVAARVSLNRRQMLVWCDVHYPGWNVYLDGSPAELWKVNGIFRGVSVPAGEHQVTFRFEPASFRHGLIASLSCIGLLMMVGILSRR
ncbi:MAG TPA: YfhO family protein [Phycisphaerae bacterium]|nr:YfhO family protein [Phycisphaerae bacterium]HRY67072.1 YfhO family protein [Phycisphaerae bacterium]HSA29822.1 YfhO family protein [Phycisphaerae bacterium]